MKMGKIKMGRGAAAVSGQPDRFCRKLQLSDDIIKSSQQVSRVSKKLNHEKQSVSMISCFCFTKKKLQHKTDWWRYPRPSPLCLNPGLNLFVR